MARRPPSELSRLAAASLPPAPGVEREPLPPSRAGGPRAIARARLHLHPSGLTASRLSPHQSSSSLGGLSRSRPHHAPYACSGRWGRRLPGNALPGARSEPSLGAPWLAELEAGARPPPPTPSPRGSPAPARFNGRKAEHPEPGLGNPAPQRGGARLQTPLHRHPPHEGGPPAKAGGVAVQATG